jgi:hypothetical protein
LKPRSKGKGKSKGKKKKKKESGDGVFCLAVAPLNAERAFL